MSVRAEITESRVLSQIFSAVSGDLIRYLPETILDLVKTGNGADFVLISASRATGPRWRR